MTKENSSIFIAAAVGAFATLASIAGFIKGGEFSNHSLGLFCGITLLGTAFIHHMSIKREK